MTDAGLVWESPGGVVVTDPAGDSKVLAPPDARNWDRYRRPRLVRRQSVGSGSPVRRVRRHNRRSTERATAAAQVQPGLSRDPGGHRDVYARQGASVCGSARAMLPDWQGTLRGRAGHRPALSPVTRARPASPALSKAWRHPDGTSPWPTQRPRHPVCGPLTRKHVCSCGSSTPLPAPSSTRSQHRRASRCTVRRSSRSTAGATCSLPLTAMRCRQGCWRTSHGRRPAYPPGGGPGHASPWAIRRRSGNTPCSRPGASHTWPAEESTSGICSTARHARSSRSRAR